MTTLTYNLFADKYENEHKYMIGILTTDISDRYPIFQISQIQKKTKGKDHQIILRLINGSNSEKYVNDVQ